MELFKNTNFDFLGKKWPFIIASLVLTAAGLISLAMKGGPRYGIDFRGGTIMDVRFAQAPPVDKIRTTLSNKLHSEVTVQRVGDPGNNEVMIGTEGAGTDTELGATRQTIVQTLSEVLGENGGGKLDLNEAGAGAIASALREPLIQSGVTLSDEQITQLAEHIRSHRDTGLGGLVTNYDQLAQVPGMTPQVMNALKQTTYLAPFAVKGVDSVGPKVGGELRTQAILATLYALGGMLVYIAFRFEWIYGVAAVIAVFHDTIITIGLFSIFNKEISLTVIAALLTLVGYSMNDTIVVFDRIRENLKIMRREKLDSLVNLSVNQTLSRTVLTSGLTFLTVLALFLFGGEVLHGFAFALVVGIIIGTYSSIFIASPIVIFWHNMVDKRKRPGGMAAAPAVSSPSRKTSAKVK
jgi:preprotein translocase subunit SecF